MEADDRQRRLDDELEQPERGGVRSAGSDADSNSSAGRLAAPPVPSGATPTDAEVELRARLAEQAEAAEQYRVEAADLRSMFDAMQHRIDVLQQKVQSPPPGAAAAVRIADLETAAAALEARIVESSGTESELRRALEEAESALAATRRARDQWIERLEASGREKVELERQLAAGSEPGAGSTADLEQVAQLEARAQSAVAERDEAVAHLAAQEERIDAILKTWTLAEEESTSLAVSQGEIARQVAALVDDVETTRLLSDDLCDGLREDRRRIDELADRLDANPVASGESGEARARIDALQSEVERLAGAAAAEAKLRELLDELEAQRSALAEEVEAERSQRVELERAAEAWRASPPPADAGDPAVVEAQLGALQEAFDEAVALHAEETRALREEVVLQRSLARDRENEMDRLSAECAILQESVEEAISDLEGVRAEQRDLSEELLQFDSSTPSDAPVINGGAAAVAVAAVADDTADVAVIEDDESNAADGGADDLAIDSETANLVVINVDGDPVFQGAVEAAVATVPGAELCTSVDREVAPGTYVEVTVNLASEHFRLDLIAGADCWGLDEPEVIAYCGKNGRGVFFRRVMFLPPPCDLDECSTRLLSGADTLQRLLVVGEDVDFMSGLRESLGRVRASTAIAFDGRQAMDLIPMVKPQTVLVDLNLPRGDGLRVAAQIAANRDLRNVRIAMFWTKAVDPLVFRQQAIFSMRDFHMSPEQLTHAMSQILRDPHRRARSTGSMPPVIRRGFRQGSPNPPGN